MSTAARASTQATVTDGTQARRLMSTVCQDLRRAGGVDLGDGDWIDLTLVAREELLPNPRVPWSTRPRGRASYRRTRRGEKVTTTYRIHILSGLSVFDFSACCAHELGHIYQYRAGTPDLPAFLREGLCDLFAFTWHRAQGPEHAEQALRTMWMRTSPVYSEGFRSVFPALLERRLVDVVEYVGTYGHLPPVLAGASHVV